MTVFFLPMRSFRRGKNNFWRGCGKILWHYLRQSVVTAGDIYIYIYIYTYLCEKVIMFSSKFFGRVGGNLSLIYHRLEIAN